MAAGLRESSEPTRLIDEYEKVRARARITL
jgi:hypothetical protein